jgi:hypothetical protein
MAANPRYDVIGGFLSPVQKDLAPAAQRRRMLELCLGSNSWVLTAATSAPGPGLAPACICTGTASAP